MAKRKTYGKTTKQWDKLYNDYKSKLKGERGISRLNKTEFKKAWVNRPSGTTVKDLARETRKEDKFTQYKREYNRFEKRGYQMGSELSEKIFKQEISEYSSVKDLVESQFFVSRKQADNWMKHAQKLGLQDINITDFFKENAKSQTFWNRVDELGGWEAAFEY